MATLQEELGKIKLAPLVEAAEIPLPVALTGMDKLLATILMPVLYVRNLFVPEIQKNGHLAGMLGATDTLIADANRQKNDRSRANTTLTQKRTQRRLDAERILADSRKNGHDPLGAMAIGYPDLPDAVHSAGDRQLEKEQRAINTNRTVQERKRNSPRHERDRLFESNNRNRTLERKQGRTNGHGEYEPFIVTEPTANGHHTNGTGTKKSSDTQAITAKEAAKEEIKFNRKIEKQARRRAGKEAIKQRELETSFEREGRTKSATPVGPEAWDTASLETHEQYQARIDAEGLKHARQENAERMYKAHDERMRAAQEAQQPIQIVEQPIGTSPVTSHSYNVDNAKPNRRKAKGEMRGSVSAEEDYIGNAERAEIKREYKRNNKNNKKRSDNETHAQRQTKHEARNENTVLLTQDEISAVNGLEAEAAELAKQQEYLNWHADNHIIEPAAPTAREAWEATNPKTRKQLRTETNKEAFEKAHADSDAFRVAESDKKWASEAEQYAAEVAQKAEKAEKGIATQTAAEATAATSFVSRVATGYKGFINGRGKGTKVAISVGEVGIGAALVKSGLGKFTNSIGNNVTVSGVEAQNPTFGSKVAGAAEIAAGVGSTALGVCTAVLAARSGGAARV